MRQTSIIPRLALILAVFLTSANKTSAEVLAQDSVSEIQQHTVDLTTYQNNVDSRMKLWQKLMPEMFTVQYAGNIGMISAGLGWDYGKHDRWETHLLIGFLPKRHKFNHYWTITLREIYNPWELKLAGRWSIKPLSVNFSMNSILHHDFWMSEPDRYPHGYYGFSSRLRFQLGVGQRFTFNIPENKRVFNSRLSVYYEISTTDLYIRQKSLNSSIPLKDIIALGIGIIYEL